jgi:DNA polymerase-3 subunit alpha
VAEFAGYGFNKSHAAAYALIAYQTGWLKANHPAAFMAGLMSLDSANTEKLAVFFQEAKRIGS